MASTVTAATSGQPIQREGVLVRIAIGFTSWAERWFPDAFIFVAIAVVVVAVASLANGASPAAVSVAFGNGFWSLITFTMQMAFVAIGGYVVATSAPARRLIGWLADLPNNGRSAVGLVAVVSMLASLLNWGLSLILGGLLVLALAARPELRMDYRAGAAAAYLGLGATWAMGLSSSAAQLQANAASLPKTLLPITGVIPFSETIFLWQSVVITAVLLMVSGVIAVWSAPGPNTAVTAEAMGIKASRDDSIEVAPPQQPGEWLEHSPILTVLLALLAIGWVIYEFSRQDWMIAISNLNTYNFIFIMLGLLLHWRPKRFLAAVVKSVPATSGVLIQFPFYGAIAAILTQAKNGAGVTVSDQISHAFVSMSTQHLFPLVIGIYSAILGFFIPSGGGKWLLEAPYVMQAANDLKVHHGWAVQVVQRRGSIA
jgi:short-chain fatty acids transporter